MQKTGQCGSRDDGGEIVARQQHCHDTVAPFEQSTENQRVCVAALAFCTNFQIIGGNQRNFAGGEKRLANNTGDYRSNQDQDGHFNTVLGFDPPGVSV